MAEDSTGDKKIAGETMDNELIPLHGRLFFFLMREDGSNCAFGLQKLESVHKFSATAASGKGSTLII